MSDDLIAEIDAAYGTLRSLDGAKGPIRPFLGAAFGEAESNALRVMAIGLNAHCRADESPTGDHWRSGVAGDRWHFARQLRRDLRALTTGIEGARTLGGRRYAAPDSLYLTNAVKRWLPDAQDARAVEERWFEEGAAVLQAELAALHAAGRLPHLVVVAGARAWAQVWPAFSPSRAPWAERYDAQAETSPLRHFLNVVTVQEAGGVRPLLLLRLRHPAAARWDQGMSPKRLLAQPDLRRAVGLEAT